MLIESPRTEISIPIPTHPSFLSTYSSCPCTWKGRHKKTGFFLLSVKKLRPPSPSPFFDHLSFFSDKDFFDLAVAQTPPLSAKNGKKTTVFLYKSNWPLWPLNRDRVSTTVQHSLKSFLKKHPQTSVLPQEHTAFRESTFIVYGNSFYRNVTGKLQEKFSIKLSIISSFLYHLRISEKWKKVWQLLSPCTLHFPSGRPPAR